MDLAGVIIGWHVGYRRPRLGHTDATRRLVTLDDPRMNESLGDRLAGS
jgi:hypothetical protein